MDKYKQYNFIKIPDLEFEYMCSIIGNTGKWILICHSGEFADLFNKYINEFYPETKTSQSVCEQISDEVNIGLSTLQDYIYGLRNGRLTGNRDYLTFNIGSVSLESRLEVIEKILGALKVNKTSRLYEIIEEVKYD